MHVPDMRLLAECEKRVTSLQRTQHLKPRKGRILFTSHSTPTGKNTCWSLYSSSRHLMDCEQLERKIMSWRAVGLKHNMSHAECILTKTVLDSLWVVVPGSMQKALLKTCQHNISSNTCETSISHLTCQQCLQAVLLAVHNVKHNCKPVTSRLFPLLLAAGRANETLKSNP